MLLFHIRELSFSSFSLKLNYLTNIFSYSGVLHFFPVKFASEQPQKLQYRDNNFFLFALVTLNSSSSYEEALDANQNSIDCKKLESNTSNTSNIALVNTPLGAVHSQSISSCSSTSINGDPFTRPNSDSFSFGDASTVALSDSVDSEQYRSSGDNSEHESSPDFRDTPQFGDKVSFSF